MSQESLSEFVSGHIEDRNWCVLTEEGIKGPFSAVEIKQYYAEKKLKLHHRIWHKKNSSWMHLSAIKHLIEVPKEKQDLVNAALLMSAQNAKIKKDNDNIKKLSWLEDVSIVPKLDSNTKISGGPLRSRVAFVCGLMVSIGLTVFMFGKRFSLPPQEIQLLNKADQEKAELIIASSGLFAKPQTEVFLVPDSQYNQFLIVSNKNQNQRYRLRVVGKPETLLQTFRAEYESSFNVSKEVALVSLQPENRIAALPLGKYNMYLECLGCEEKGARIIFNSELFLGGKEDEYYTSSLTQYHIQLRQQAIAELKYLKQLGLAMLKINRMKASKELQEESQVVATEMESLEAEVKANKYFYGDHVADLKELLSQSLQSQSSADSKANFARKVDDFLGRIEYLLNQAEKNKGFPKKI